jgi:CheY-like chemotaxis protein/anti-sigma regulatory factor (Ser/Thr protein kinase)
MRSYLTRLLSSHWRVRTCTNGEEALASIAEQRPDVVLTDVMMPRVDGFELLRRLRADAATRRIPVIMLTARAGQEAAVEGLAAGADDYLAKPFQAAELIARVRVAVQRVADGGSAVVPPAPTTAPPAVPAIPPVAPDVRALVPASRPPAVAPAPPPEPPLAERWRFPATPQAVPALRRALRRLFTAAGLAEDQAYDLLLATCEAATNAVEHAQDPLEPVVDVTAELTGDRVVITVRDFGQWRERVPSMDRGRGSTLMSAFADVTVVPGPEGTTVTIRAPRSEDSPGHPDPH